MQRLTVDGRFFRLGDERVFLKLVTYGPFPGGWPEDFHEDFRRIAEAGFQALRLYEWPSGELLDAAAANGLHVFAGHHWPSARDFLNRGEHPFETWCIALWTRLADTGRHPALAGVFVANEIPSDLVRWMGAPRVLEAIETLIAGGREVAADLLWAYSNYPSTEYLEPANADFTAMNVYLEDGQDFSRYLRRLQHVAGDRPVMISEFGFDSRRGGLEKQAETLDWGINRAREGGAAGMAVYAWSDRWWNAGAEVPDWDFGLTDREGLDKPALDAVRTAFAKAPEAPEAPSFSVIVCCRDGRDRIGACLRSLEALHGPEAEIIVVDDGSSDGTADLIEKEFPGVKTIRLETAGLSAARNAGAEAATGEVVAFTDDDCEVDPDWLVEIARVFTDGWDAVGGPNLPPRPRDLANAVVTAAPGAASHVMLDDREAEHVPGCNIAVRRTAYFQIGGFDPDFRTAGDDVDFCWRLRDAGMRIGFAPNAFVWHHRRTSPLGYLRQQIGYGRAERLLRQKHPDRFSPSGDAMWRGVIYSGAPVRAAGEPIIYHGPMGMAGYQGLVTRMQPLRPLDPRFDRWLGRCLLRVVTWITPRLRSRARTGRFRGPVPRPSYSLEPPDREFSCDSAEPREVVLRRLLEAGWHAAGPTDGWDLEKDGSRLLIARERFEKGEGRLLVRVWGEAPVDL